LIGQRAELRSRLAGEFREDGQGEKVLAVPDGTVTPEAAVVTVVLGGQTKAETVTFKQPGHYVFVCNVPGHYQSGMHGTLVVQ